WSGGTRIGESFAQFNREWPHLVDRRTIVIVLSDGWDTGEPDVLATELLRIKRRAARVIWLNPLLGNPSYEPLTRGMAAAMPLIDDFAPGHNLASLRDLAGKLHL
ncbi:MAG TPA: VWA domain-containing protein, partial [Methylomirabilota bacterium]|nr:VWA domain-containing protein [Methylomirabilota bacterium]